MREALFYEKLNGKVRCNLCRHRCIIVEGKRGICRVREVRDGKLYSLVYGKPISLNIDPIEKKPLFHFLPGTRTFSLATVGCNFRCDFCQNWEISQEIHPPFERMKGSEVPPEMVVEYAKKYRCYSISHTYTEPTIFYEYAFDIAKRSAEEGILNIFVTNGYITEEALKGISPYLHAANIDLKGWNDEYYRRIMGARLSEVLDSIKVYKRLGIWIEITTLVVPGWSDKEEDFKEIARFIRDELGKETPWHISRFHPHYKMMDVPPTPIESLKRAYEIGKEEGLSFVYLGNVPGMGEDTHCPGCGSVLIRRWGFDLIENKIKDGKCPKCNTPIPGIWERI
jgi:pyruvate formate lyase activating enzyme